MDDRDYYTITCDCCGKLIYNAKTDKMLVKEAWHFEGGPDYCSEAWLIRGAGMTSDEFAAEDHDEDNTMWWEGPEKGDNDPYDLREEYIIEAMPIGPKTPNFELKMAYNKLKFWTARDKHLWSGMKLYEMKQRKRRATSELSRRGLLAKANSANWWEES